MKVRIHYVLKNKIYAQRVVSHVPSKGDEVRFKGITYKIILIVWCMDEENSANERVNIQIEKVKVSKK